jgi:Acyl-CoA dehydrogenases
VPALSRNETLKGILSRLDKDVFIGTLSYSDPETGSHFWYPISSGAEKVEGGWKVRKKASWTTSGGFADWYIIQTTSPDFGGNYADLSCWLIMGNEVKAEPSKWDGLGLRGNQSGTLEVDNVVIPADRLVGPKGDGANSNDECVDPFFLLCSSSCWNGISLGLIDIAKRHTTMKKHADVGMRVADYPTIQDYVGEAISDTNASRAMVFQMAHAMDTATNNCDWSLHRDLAKLPRAQYLHWMWQVKFNAAKNVAHVADKMLHACGGTGYKPGLGDRALSARRQGRLGHGTHQRGAAPVHRQGLAPRLRHPGLLEPGGERAGAEQRDQEARQRRQAGAGREVAEGGGREQGRGVSDRPE